MKAKFLLQHREVDGTHEVACLSVGLFSPWFPSRADATAGIATMLREYLDCEGKEFVQSWMGNSEVINCPEGYVKLPIDLWCCKLNDAACNLQAQVFLKDHTLFLSRCTAPDERKAGILKAASEGRYGGFHHLPGRNLCPACECKSPFNYHYRFELTFVPQLLGIAEEVELDSLRQKALRLDLPSYALACALCPPCASRIASAMVGDVSNNLEIVEIDFSPR